jgi:hypothetical protein
MLSTDRTGGVSASEGAANPAVNIALTAPVRTMVLICPRHMRTSCPLNCNPQTFMVILFRP